MLKILAVFVGGGLGSICRYGIARALSPYNFIFPYATLVANIFSCILIGYLMFLGLKSQLSEASKVFLIIGFCGGFSTFSSFSKDTYLLFQKGEHLLALTNIGGSVILCLISIYLGMQVARMVHSGI